MPRADRDACMYLVHTTYVHMYVVHRYNKMKRKRVWRARNSIHLGSLDDPVLAMIFAHHYMDIIIAEICSGILLLYM